MRLYRALVTDQLAKLADEGRTGVLRLANGAIHLSEGAVVHAEHEGTPDLASRLARWPGGTQGAAPSPAERAWVIREAIADAAAGLLSGPSRDGRFKASGVLSAGGVPGMPVAELLAEVARRGKLMRQLAPLLTADTVVARNPRIHADAVQVSAAQWALLIRMAEPATPRDLAMRSGSSVLGTTIEVFRLIVMNLAAAPDGERPRGHEDSFPDYKGHKTALSFVRATASLAGVITNARSRGRGRKRGSRGTAGRRSARLWRGCPQGTAIAAGEGDRRLREPGRDERWAPPRARPSRP